MPEMTPEELEDYNAAWPGSSDTEAQARAAITDVNRAPEIAGPKLNVISDVGLVRPLRVPVARQAIIGRPEETRVGQAHDEPPEIFSDPLSAPEGSSLAAEETAGEYLQGLMAFLASSTAREEQIDLMGILGSIASRLAVARAIREHTDSLSEPPKAYRIDGRTGKIEEIGHDDAGD